MTSKILAVSFTQVSRETQKQIALKQMLEFVVNGIEQMHFEMKIVFYKILYLTGEIDEIFLRKLEYNSNILNKVSGGN